MVLSDIITAIIAVGGIIFSYYGIRKQLRADLYAHYSRLYYDLMLEMMNVSDNPEKCEKIAEIYIDLCSEEFQLHWQKKVDDDTWRHWSEGILCTLSKPVYASVWERVSQGDYYDKEFVEFVEKGNTK